MRPGRDVTWDAFVAAAAGQPGDCERMEANEPAYILATSGTTAKPKLAIHTHGGYQVHIVSMGRWCFGLKPADVWWATSDIGWIVGHSYMVYAPLITGCTTVVFEGALDHPTPEANWRIGVEEFGVTGIFTSPTAIRTLMKYGDEPLRRVDHSRLERVVCAGEVLNPAALDWLQNTILDGRVPVIDHMWQTETGGPVFGNPYGIGMLPDQARLGHDPLPGIEAAVVTPDGEPCAPGEKGIMVLKRPFPGLIAALWGEPERYGRDYWEKIPGVYYTGDSAHIDEDGYVWFGGRSDEIIKIAGHRIGTIEVESAFLKHPSVAECGVVGRPDETRGEVISAFVLLKNGHEQSPELRQALLGTVRREMGPVAVIGELNFVSMLPKTRSGKIMRRVLKAVILDRDPGDITTIEDEGSVDEARQAWAQMKAEISLGPGSADRALTHHKGHKGHEGKRSCGVSGFSRTPGCKNPAERFVDTPPKNFDRSRARLFHRLLKVHGGHGLAEVGARVVPNSIPERSLTQLLAQEMQHVRALPVHQRPIISGWAIPIRKDERPIVAGVTNRFITPTDGVDLLQILLSPQTVLDIGSGHERREPFVEPEMGPVTTGDHVAPPLVGKFMSAE